MPSPAKPSANLTLRLDVPDVFDVREFRVHERISALFSVELVVLCESANVDFNAVLGGRAKFRMRSERRVRTWIGICNHIRLLGAEETGLSTYLVCIVPDLWLATQRRNYRMFQHETEPDIVRKVLTDWSIEPLSKLTETYKKRKYRVQYAENDFAFICRMLEDAGISFYFERIDKGTKMVLSDAPHLRETRAPALPFRDDTSLVTTEYVTQVSMDQKVRPGKYTMRDHDYRRPADYKLSSSAAHAFANVEDRLERYHYVPGAFLFGASRGEDTPHADDRGKARTDEREGQVLAEKRLHAKRAQAKSCTFETNAWDLAPGCVMRMSGHPRAKLNAESWLVLGVSHVGSSHGPWTHQVEVTSTDVPYRPALSTPKPKVNGMESATVVGPADEEIHCDEFGRVRVHFHWDRESNMDDRSSCWIHVSQPWGGAGYGGSALPRIGQEVLVDFLGGDPDRPVIVGRVYTNLQQTPYKLPDNKTQTGIKSNSTGGGGGYNELMFEDAQGKELVRMQAEKDLKKLVKNDEAVTIGRNRTKLVKANDSLTVGANRTKRVVANETSSIGMNQKISVGVNRSTHVGLIDSTTVGDTHSVTITPPGEGGPGGDNTTMYMLDKKIVLDTGAGAKITMEGSTITLSATTIMIQAKAFLGACSAGATVVGGVGALVLGSPAFTSLYGGAFVTVASGGAMNVGAAGVLAIKSSGGDVKINGGPMVKVNM